jgi:hypothetical protein
MGKALALRDDQQFSGAFRRGRRSGRRGAFHLRDLIGRGRLEFCGRQIRAEEQRDGEGQDACAYGEHDGIPFHIGRWVRW